MTIGDLEARAEMSRANIRYYEQEGLLVPARRENGYRDYTEEDLETLLRIKLLRQLNFSLGEIRQLQRGEMDFSAALARRGTELEQERERLDTARQVCLDIGREIRTFAELPASIYLARLTDSVSAVQREELPPPHPWRRFFARSLDRELAALVILLIQSQVLHGPIRNTMAASMGWLLLSWGVLLLVEPLLIHFLGTTPGKWIWGISVEKTGGGRLPLWESYSRTIRVFVSGEGLAIPFASTICNIFSYRQYTQGEELSWEGDSVLRFREREWVGPIAYIAAIVAKICCVVLLLLSSYLPMNRKDLTMVEFAENYNVYVEKLGIFASSLDMDGKWVVTKEPNRFNPFEVQGLPELTYEEENGVLRAVSCTLTLENQVDPFVVPIDEIRMVALSFVAARPGTNAFNISSLLSGIDGWNTTDSNCLQWQDVSLTYAVDCEGVGSAADILFPEEGQANHFILTFRAEIDG